MELNSIIVRSLFIVLQIACLSSLPLGRLFLEVFWKMKVTTAILVVFNFILSSWISNCWGLTAQVVIEVLGTSLGVALLWRGNPHVEKGLKILLGKRYLLAWGKGVIYILRTREGRDAWLQAYLEDGQPAWAVTEEQAALLIEKDPEFWAFREMERQTPND